MKADRRELASDQGKMITVVIETFARCQLYSYESIITKAANMRPVKSCAS